MEKRPLKKLREINHGHFEDNAGFEREYVLTFLPFVYFIL